MSKFNALIKGVTEYPAVGYPLLSVVDCKPQWFGHIWIDRMNGKYTDPRPTPDEANELAAAQIEKMKEGKNV